ncbi:hypothetical protein [Antarctobacter heliothermus]|uniref:Uncharacterized protein n=1 Tax=Antarctobacter heliothermus TaxID=74033 RepID=A0A239EYX9_9RHOB|nr:hypothetical protein [Antarctobacter heliothermus]SNS49488.1 hypothetical protein SAMN04488078_101748 [Antarctobacter heliothermus]
MTQPEEYLPAFLASIESLDPDSQIGHARGLVVAVLEHLGYVLARDTDTTAATSAFILAADLEKRLNSLELMIGSDGAS